MRKYGAIDQSSRGSWREQAKKKAKKKERKGDGDRF